MTKQEIALKAIADGSLKPKYSHWRHGGWYVDNLRYPSGAVGCVARYRNGKEWRIACDPRDPEPIFRNRDEAARAEASLVLALWRAAHIEAATKRESTYA